MSLLFLIQFLVDKIITITRAGSTMFFQKFFQELKGLIPFIALLIFLVNASLSKDSFILSKEKILLNKNDVISRQLLINLFLLNNQFQIAARESQNGLAVSKTDNQRKTFKELINQAILLEKQEAAISKEMISWRTLLSLYPQYRDAYIKLAILSWKTNHLFEAKKNLEQALIIDPNFETTKKILEVLPRS